MHCAANAAPALRYAQLGRSPHPPATQRLPVISGAPLGKNAPADTTKNQGNGHSQPVRVTACAGEVHRSRTGLRSRGVGRVVVVLIRIEERTAIGNLTVGGTCTQG